MMKIMAYLYFAYGSNLLSSRMHVQNPAARRIGIARLDNHRLDFEYKSTRWGGCAATIVPDSDEHVWGALWEVTDLVSLDDQEGVPEKIYFPKEVSVVRPDNQSLTCRTYQLVNLPHEKYKKQPSRVYLETILQGAVETGLPQDYIKKLREIKHNGFTGPITIPNFNISFKETS